jgi:Fe-S oxidoreductase
MPTFTPPGNFGSTPERQTPQGILMDVNRFFNQEKQRVLEECLVCGMCVETCPIIPVTGLAEDDPRDVQQAVLDCLDRDTVSTALRERIQSCMKCYGCVRLCPQDLNPLRTLEICSAKMADQGNLEFPAWDPKAPDLVHRVLASIQTTPDEYARLFTPSKNTPADTVFFAGCNVYYQPEKLFNALDIMDRLDADAAFVPGLDYCCGNCHLIRGRVNRAGNAFQELMDKLVSYTPKTVVLWCPTCFCLADTTFGAFTEYPFEILSMAQYVSRNLDRLDIIETASARVTIHDACKIALTGLDVDGCREILSAIGAEIVEMPRSRETTVCCGSAAIGNYPEAGNRMRDTRLQEAADTGADTLVTVCHYCNQVFAARQDTVALNIESYISLLAAALGIVREDKFSKYVRWADPVRILEDAAEHVEKSPFPLTLIEETVREVFTQT